MTEEASRPKFQHVFEDDHSQHCFYDTSSAPNPRLALASVGYVGLWDGRQMTYRLATTIVSPVVRA